MTRAKDAFPEDARPEETHEASPDITPEAIEELLQLFHGMIARATEGIWHREPEEAALTLEQAHEVLETLEPVLERAHFERLLNSWINTAQLVEHASDYGPDQDRPR